jgi:dienelactone hydrolase
MPAMSDSLPFALGSLHGLIDLPEEAGERPAVVVCHGFKGFQEWGFFPYLAALLADRGFVVIRFNLSGAGRELADLLAVLESTGRTLAPGRVDRSRLGLFGHSRGGGNAILAAAREPWLDQIQALVTWASLAGFDVLAAARTIRAPWLIVHGEEDESVPVTDADRLAEASSGELLHIPGANHTFGARHPFVGPTPQLIQALNATQRWFRRHLVG